LIYVVDTLKWIITNFRRYEMNEMKLEQALQRIEAIVEKLESGELELEETIQYFKEGTDLVKFCTSRIESLELKITQLTSTLGSAEKEEN
jgi:exodeoxyribonuclease VII small subunit